MKPTLQEQIDYMTKIMQEYEVNIKFMKRDKQMAPLVKSIEAMNKGILENLIALRNFEAAEQPLMKACHKLIHCDHYEHFAARLNDQEMEALDEIKELIKGKEVRHA